LGLCNLGHSRHNQFESEVFRMRETWLHTNRRAILLGMLLPGSIAVLGAVLALAAWQLDSAWWWAGLGLACAAAGLVMLASLAWWLYVPRLAYEAGELLVFIDSRPIRVPIDVVEVFFLGQGPSFLPELAGRELETANVIVRLAESAGEWKHLDVNPRIAHWCEGYITLRGAWCEPIEPEGLRKLNARLAEIHRERKAVALAGAGAERT
jgi:hypothetical protein